MEAKHSKPAAGRHADVARGSAEDPREDALASRAEDAALRDERPAGPQEGSVRYLDGKGLRRPLDPPRLVQRGMLAFAAVAVVVGGFALFQWIDRVFIAPANEQEALQQSLTREVSADIPVLSSLMPLDDAAMMQTFADAGYTLYERTAVGANPEGGFDVVKLPSDVPLEEAGLLYLQGINNISAASAAKLLKGSWDLEVSRKSGTVLRLHYADFSATDADAAIFGAMESQGLDSTMVTDAGVDDAGNTYQAGTVGDYTWRISVIALSEVYKSKGLPATAQYVGIRFSS